MSFDYNLFLFLLLLLQYLFKNVECLKVITSTLVKQGYTDFLILRILLNNPIFNYHYHSKMNKFRTGLENNYILNMTKKNSTKATRSVYNSKNTLACKVNNISLEKIKKYQYKRNNIPDLTSQCRVKKIWPL